MTEDRDPIRLGIVGTGAISQVVHVPIFAERHDVDLVALADTDVHKAETLSRRFSAPLVMDPSDLIVFDELDAVVICTPNDVHEQMAIDALEAGKHVFVERPLAVTAEGAARVIQAAERSGKVLSVGMPHRFRPEVVALRSFVAGAELGDLFAVRGSWLTRSIAAMRSSWRGNHAVAGGGALMDLGVPALDLCLWVIGYPEVKRLLCILGPSEQGVESAATLMLETTDGVALTLEVSNRFFSGEDRFYVRVMGSEGSGLVPPFEVFKQLGGRPMEVTPRQPKPRGGENPYTNAYRRLLDDFVRRVSGLNEVALPREQEQLMSLVEAAYASARTGREIEL
jgi:predicted dehydrogenase